MARNDGTHGARPLSGLMSVILGLVLMVAAAAAIWLVVSFPLWWSGAPRFGLPVAVSIEGDQAPIELATDLGVIEAEDWRGELVIGHVSAGAVPLSVDWSSEFSQHGFVAGWVLVVLSAALKQGADLRDEQSLTV